LATWHSNVKLSK